jgi:hypothetical protein
LSLSGELFVFPLPEENAKIVVKGNVDLQHFTLDSMPFEKFQNIVNNILKQKDEKSGTNFANLSQKHKLLHFNIKCNNFMFVTNYMAYNEG